MEEEFDLVDASGRIIGKALRQECHGNPALVHRAVHILVFNHAGELYLQKRAPDKDVQPDRWDTSVGGHVALGESYEQAAIREMREELAMEAVPIEHLYDYPWRTDFESENIRTFRAIAEGPFTVDPIEISEGRFWGHQQIRESLGKGVFTPNFEYEYQRYLNRGEA
jgi:isopentenyldiphosphate isomerase